MNLHKPSLLTLSCLMTMLLFFLITVSQAMVQEDPCIKYEVEVLGEESFNIELKMAAKNNNTTGNNSNNNNTCNNLPPCWYNVDLRFCDPDKLEIEIQRINHDQHKCQLTACVGGCLKVFRVVTPESQITSENFILPDLDRASLKLTSVPKFSPTEVIIPLEVNWKPQWLRNWSVEVTFCDDTKGPTYKWYYLGQDPTVTVKGKFVQGLCYSIWYRQMLDHSTTGTSTCQTIKAPLTNLTCQYHEEASNTNTLTVVLCVCALVVLVVVLILYPRLRLRGYLHHYNVNYWQGLKSEGDVLLLYCDQDDPRVTRACRDLGEDIRNRCRRKVHDICRLTGPEVHQPGANTWLYDVLMAQEQVTVLLVQSEAVRSAIRALDRDPRDLSGNVENMSLTISSLLHKSLQIIQENPAQLSHRLVIITMFEEVYQDMRLIIPTRIPPFHLPRERDSLLNCLTPDHTSNAHQV